MIHSLHRQGDGSYVALNRRYQPLGLNSASHVKGEEFAEGFKFKRTLTAEQIAALSFNGDASPERIYLYDDGCIPTDSPSAWTAYAERLGRLASYKIVT
ncbi:MAG: hypothetical protein Q8R67_04455 [Rhodoferax sp.]|nr:hypothetical protein [Rhodoferax sp.]MDP3650917.1 hypothetical protein [Rhodoferax sp.]